MSKSVLPFLASALLGVGVLPLAACGVGGPKASPKGAAESASRLIAAAMANDRMAFEAEIDRAAVREDVRRQVSEMAKDKALDVEGGPSEFALDRMISPDAFRIVQADTLARPSAPPTPDQVRPMMSELDGGQACLRSAGETTKAATAQDCQLVFARAEGRWRLVGMKAMDLTLTLPPGGAS